MTEFKPFENELAGLLAALSPAGRRRLTVDIAKKLRQQQQQRINAQKNPDGSPYAKRKPQPLRAKKGRIKREMFTKLRTNRYMKASGNDSSAVVEFTGKVQRIAQVHQLGLKDRPGRNSVAIEYPARQLLGFVQENLRQIEKLVIEHLSSN
ncbi:phage virion morphogenesis protein [Kosakonia sp. H7A]|uniref:phage virion morphogenesis protein n=1 Tax=Kosakonia sp. H7A TaxID=2054598 RepID=UPI000D1547D6|nr:phage virion morphogenesis protein [Kosakonia sp. H7A]PTA87856.1 phage virion morphogenesis protein [Kosakonia sp. H7A]